MPTAEREVASGVRTEPSGQASREIDSNSRHGSVSRATYLHSRETATPVWVLPTHGALPLHEGLPRVPTHEPRVSFVRAIARHPPRQFEEVAVLIRHLAQRSIVTILAQLSFLGLICGVSNATTITFDSLVGSNGDEFLGLTQDDFLVTPTTGEWLEAHLNGNPTPSIFGRSDIGIVEVTENTTGLFTFSSIDLAHGTLGLPGTYSIEGFLNSVSVLLTSGTMPLLDFGTIGSPDSSQLLDTLAITMNKEGVSYNIDNIVLVVQTVPEPSAFLLSASGLIGLANRRRARKAVLARRCMRPPARPET